MSYSPSSSLPPPPPLLLLLLLPLFLLLLLLLLLLCLQRVKQSLILCQICQLQNGILNYSSMNNNPELDGVRLKVMYHRIRNYDFLNALCTYNVEGNDLQHADIGLLCWGFDLQFFGMTVKRLLFR